MRTTNLPPLSRAEWMVLAFTAVLALCAMSGATVGRVGDGTPEPTLVPATSGGPTIYQPEEP